MSKSEAVMKWPAARPRVVGPSDTVEDVADARARDAAAGGELTSPVRRKLEPISEDPRRDGMSRIVSGLL